MSYFPTQLLPWEEAREILLGSLLDHFPDRKLPDDLLWYEDKQKKLWEKYYVSDPIKREKWKEQWLAKTTKGEQNG